MKKVFLTILLLTAVSAFFTLHAAGTFSRDKEFESSQLSGKNFTRISSFAKYGLELVDDAKAFDGKAMALRKHPKGSDLHKYDDFQLGIYCEVTKKNLARRVLLKKDLPQDENFHFYRIGRITLSKRISFFSHRSWAMQQNLNKFYNADDAKKNLVEVYVSVKFTGPAYVKNSKQENGIFIDRIVLLHVGLPTRKAADNPLPESLQGKNIVDLSSGEFIIRRDVAKGGLKMSDDPEAAGGKAMTLGPKANKPDFHKGLFKMGVYNNSTKKNLVYKQLQPGEIAKDEKYHLVPMGKTKLVPNIFFWGHKSWLMQQNLNNIAKITGENVCEVLVSIKFTGPSYVPGSTSEDGVWIDRILFVY